VSNVPPDDDLPREVLAVKFVCLLSGFFDDLYKDILEWKRISEVPGQSEDVADILLKAEEKEIDAFIKVQNDYGCFQVFKHTHNDDLKEVCGIWEFFLVEWNGKDKRKKKGSLVAKLAFMKVKINLTASQCYWALGRQWKERIIPALKSSIGALRMPLKVLTSVQSPPDANTTFAERTKIIQEIANLKDILPSLLWFNDHDATSLATDGCPKLIKLLEDGKWSEAQTMLETVIWNPVANFNKDNTPLLMGFWP